jgi:hypothetical protein
MQPMQLCQNLPFTPLFNPLNHPHVVSSGQSVSLEKMGEMLVGQLENISSTYVFCSCVISFAMF